MRRRFLAISLILLGCTQHAFADDWLAKSQEKQFDQESQIIAKASSGLIAKNQDNKQLSTKQAAAALQRVAEGIEQDHNHEFWIYEAWVEYRRDTDFDGYYSGFSVEFDADTIFAQADVYARLYLASGNTYKEYYTTSVFSISGESSLDSLEVVSDLVEGFPATDYDMLIELYDAYSDALVASFDANNDADLSLLPLESSEYEDNDTVVISYESGGSFGYWAILICLLVLFGRQPLARAEN